MSGSRALAAVGVVAILGRGCLDVGAFACSDHPECDVADGMCIDGYCAVPDPGCDSEYRWVDRAPDGKAGECTVPADTTTSSSSTSPTEPPTTSSTTTSTSDATTIDPSASDSSTTTIEASTGMQCEDDRCACGADLAAGGRHNCVTRDDGMTVCWGLNDWQQVNQDDVNPVSWPTPIELTPTAIAASENHTCAVQDDQVWCWGRNDEGQSAPLSQDNPVAPTLLDGVVAPLAMDAGLQFTCALWNGDDVTCWGENVRYQLGATGMIRVNTIDDLTFTPLGLSVGGNHACTWTDTEVWCWGDNRSAQLGIDPATENRFAEPQLVATASDVVAVAAGNGHTCAAVEGGNVVRCVGAGDVGQLGVMLPEPATWSVDSVAIEGLPPGDPVEDLQARVDHTCARLQSGDIWCWGGLQGRFLLKDDMANEPLLPPARVDAPDEFADETIVRMGVGTQHICVLTDETRVWCWGSDSVDQIGPLAPANGMDAVELDLACPP